MSFYALSIAVETYQDSSIGSVPYAENDATEFSKAVEGLGICPENTVSLINSTATKTAIESKLRTITNSLNEEDVFFLYYAGHGLAQAGKNYITCHDTINSGSEIALTSIALEYVFTLIRNSACRQVTLFLDACHGGLEIDESMRGLFSQMTDEEFKAFCHDSEYYLAFSACANEEFSYPSSQLKHGVWAYHLIQALKGEASSALTRDRFITASSLQKYFSDAVPRTLRQTRTDHAVQTPTCWGNITREYIVADLKEGIELQKACKRGINSIQDTLIRYRKSGAVRSLMGFKKGHMVPTSVNASTSSFVQRIGTEDMEGVVGAIHTKLKSKFKYKRRDLKVESGDGYSAIITPDFSYSVSLDIDQEEPSRFVLEEAVCEIQNPDIVFDDRFSNIFDGCFDTVEISFKQTVNIEDLIDAIEDHGGITVQYPPDAAYCTYSHGGHGLTIRFETNRFLLVYDTQFQIETMLADCSALPLLMDKAGVLDQLPCFSS